MPAGKSSSAIRFDEVPDQDRKSLQSKSGKIKSVFVNVCLSTSFNRPRICLLENLRWEITKFRNNSTEWAKACLKPGKLDDTKDTRACGKQMESKGETIKSTDNQIRNKRNQELGQFQHTWKDKKITQAKLLK